MATFADKLRHFALEGVDLVGYAPVAAWAGAPEGSAPTDAMPGCRSVLAFAIKHLDVFTTTKNLDSQAYSQDIVNHEMVHQAYRISRFMERAGFTAFPIVASVVQWPFDPEERRGWGRISLRHAAQFAGIGRLGRSALLLTPQFGPRVQLGAMLTDAVLPPDGEMDETPCMACDLCLEVCPAGALSLPEGDLPYVPVDRDKCMGFRREHGGASPLGYENQCALCRAVCPVGRPAGQNGQTQC